MSRSTLFVIALSGLTLAACGSPQAGGGSADGAALFATNCGECHSDDGSGSDEAPAIFGHTAEEVREQVRNPMGEMDPIATAELSDADLETIAAWVDSLPGEDAHPEIEISDEVRTHLMAAYEAIADYENMDRETAIDHLNQAAALSSGEAADMFDEMIADIQNGKAGNARHELKEMLGLEEGEH